ncbi:MAG: HAD-IB family hydrolase, partial [Neisseriaceae bacterium]|nr:HAD-IB family hydrolase [Neisseriaceae bacterium]
MNSSLVLFDLDHTLLTCDSDVEWSRYLYDKGYVGHDSEIKRKQYSDDYHAGNLNLDEFLQFQLIFLARFPIDTLGKMHQEFMSEYIIPNISPDAYALVNKHIQNNDQIILVSATNEFVITPIAHHFGINEVIGISLVKDKEGNYTGEYQGVPSYREGKITRVEQWLKEHNRTWQD